MNPQEAWNIVAGHLLSVIPKWRSDILSWLSGGMGGFDESHAVPPIAVFPLVTGPLDDEYGDVLTRALLQHYKDVDGVVDGISTGLHTDGWSGPESQHLRKKRDKFRRWLGRDFDPAVISWVEDEISHLDRRIEATEISEERDSWNRPKNTT
jgi:hypothetical protein